MAEQNTSAKPALGRLVAPIGEMIPLMTELFSKGKSVAFSPRGTSMRPMLREGRDSVILSRVDRPLKKYDVILFKDGASRYVLHRVIKLRGGVIITRGDNTYFTETLKPDAVLGVLTKYNKDGKSYSVNSRSYKLYAKQRVFFYPARKLFVASKRAFYKIARKIFKKRK